MALALADSGAGQSAAEPLLSVERLSVTYSGSRGPLTALRDATLSVDQGELVALLGPSGCGKTTLLQTAAGLIESTSGLLKFGTAVRAAGRRAVGMIPQRPALLPWASVRENALLPIELMGIKATPEILQRLDTLLSLVKLGTFEEALPRELSGGMQMRAAIVRALLPRPRLLLMDEPFAAIDEPTRLRLGLETRKLLRNDGCAALLVTHSIWEAALIADRILVMSPRPGRVVAELRPSYSEARRNEGLLDTPQFIATCGELRSLVDHA
jgi:NitT/TauT family transport system ATP-binding protein